MSNIPRPEYPNPQFEREDWVNLNGEWDFEIDKSNCGKEERGYLDHKFSRKIIVPFCPESKLSGVGETNFLNSVWYKREIDVKDTDGLVFLNIGACDYFTTVYVNGKIVGTHKGGYTAFSFDITEYVTSGKNVVVINAEDDVRNTLQPTGKQAHEFYPNGCHYTRTTGIWQTVWLTYVPKAYIKNFKIYPDSANGKIEIKADVCGDDNMTVKAFYDGKEVGYAEGRTYCGSINLTLNLTETHLWELGNGRLYDLELTYGKDKVKSYFGLRNVRIDGLKFLLNNKSVFQRTVLDQGFYPDGIYTASSEEEFIRDIQISLDAGFNGARLHEKVFEPRYLYHCDRMGYMVWGEYANWGLDHTKPEALPIFLNEWTEVINRDFNHPSIIGWCPLNEVWEVDFRYPYMELVEMVYKTTKALDTTRPCIDASGGLHIETDIYDFHNYDQNTEMYREMMEKFEKDAVLPDFYFFRQINSPNIMDYNGIAAFMSEYGGIKYEMGYENDKAWGYGEAARSVEEFAAIYRGLTEPLIRCSRLMGFCYTQLYDVEQECNGLYTYGREPKFDMTYIKEINEQKAAIE